MSEMYWGILGMLSNIYAIYLFWVLFLSNPFPLFSFLFICLPFCIWEAYVLMMSFHPAIQKSVCLLLSSKNSVQIDNTISLYCSLYTEKTVTIIRCLDSNYKGISTFCRLNF